MLFFFIERKAKVKWETPMWKMQCLFYFRIKKRTKCHENLYKIAWPKALGLLSKTTEVDYGLIKGLGIYIKKFQATLERDFFFTR